ncbi:MAG: hypothetical protein DRJ56_03330 [Thermoprotei archaeon]|nr:MAG: hypothetical protein DRJ56_03330 [Thermoprotei archaeon]
MSRRFAISDTCFVIDWSYYRRRECLVELFDVVLVPEQVLSEVEDERSISWISLQLARGSMQLFTPSPSDLREAERLILEVASRPYMRRIDVPEAVCLVVARRIGAVVLTENRGALLAARLLRELRGVAVWRALEVIRESLMRGLIEARSREEVRRAFLEYEVDTSHVFPRRDLEEAVEAVVRCLSERR